ncbi:hypothetical protein [Sutcliffiella sp. NC1]|uniref:hypothetical protein n=1 Tax=Sutcliffiella sp. NC1 TaxID=3004096 RepID=UPI0022DE4F1B|nr:hypothetical protein [Sutcliffiella sp. NC1]WBL14492.1 hypothetical protein O1A01_21875 [Sutcliffiella sp. NC1]
MTEEQITFIREYNELLEVTVEALRYLGSDRTNDGSEMEERVYYDSLLAFLKIQQMNEALLDIFHDDTEKVQAIASFEVVVHELDKISTEPVHASNEIFQHHIIPAFEAWKIHLQSHLKTVIFH